MISARAAGSPSAPRLAMVIVELRSCREPRVLDAQHRCVTTRGPRQTRSSTVTIASRGALAAPAARAEIIALIGAAERG